MHRARGRPAPLGSALSARQAIAAAALLSAVATAAVAVAGVRLFAAAADSETAPQQSAQPLQQGGGGAAAPPAADSGGGSDAAGAAAGGSAEAAAGGSAAAAPQQAAVAEGSSGGEQHAAPPPRVAPGDWQRWDTARCGKVDLWCDGFSAEQSLNGTACDPLGAAPCPKKCSLPRWAAAPEGGITYEVAAHCARLFAALCGHKVAGERSPVPRAEGAVLTQTDFPLSVVSVSHKCSSLYARARLGRTRMAVHGTHRLVCTAPKFLRWMKVEHSLMAVWAPPQPDMISRVLMQQRYYDAKLHSLFHPALDRPKPGVVADVGSNLGVLSMFAVGMGHKVYAFDATPWTRHKLLLSAAMHVSGRRFNIVPAAVGSKKGEVKLRILQGNFGGNRIVRGKGGALEDVDEGADGSPQKGGVITVPVVTLDDILLPVRPFLMKIDIEGHEIEALRGAQRLLRTVRPMLIIETAIYDLDTEGPDGLFQLLQGHGYTCAADMWYAMKGWDTEQVFNPASHAEAAPNVFCLYNPKVAPLPYKRKRGAPADAARQAPQAAA
eukprot:TRINITY_DN66411_c0_g1_i1.p1 TRINITY_DN66411_c0_g1~~TRINITY_DN66411_c0_g1_i1.p1  ORF type:complete len:550 (+),score=124.29 TRINITY_DN66411_c0_g1_i1:73-1722(+)